MPPPRLPALFLKFSNNRHVGPRYSPSGSNIRRSKEVKPQARHARGKYTPRQTSSAERIASLEQLSLYVGGTGQDRPDRETVRFLEACDAISVAPGGVRKAHRLKLADWRDL
jgi:hypothetical protein